MGEQQVDKEMSGEALRSFMQRLLTDLRALEHMIAEGMIERGVRRIGAEQELFLVDRSMRPACRAPELLERLGDPHFTHEIARFNLEANLDPQPFGGACLSRMERQLVELVDKARAAAAELGAEVVLAGILPTIRKSDLHLENMTPMPRYDALNRAMSRLRGGDYEFRIKGMDELAVNHDSIMVESCNASFQVHFQVGAEEFPKLYNIAQLVAAPILSLAANAPVLFGRRLWRETRIALFQQSVDTRGSSHDIRERLPRVTFGRSWVRESVLELFREDIKRFRALLGAQVDEDPFASLDAGEVPRLKALMLHNGTVYRWNRACYGITDGKPHLRIENRILPAGPTPLDEVANAAFWFGLIKSLSEEHDDVAEKLEFDAARENFFAAAQHGLSAQFTWLGGKVYPAAELLRERLLPAAREGLLAAAIPAEDVDRYIGVAEERVRAEQTGAQWALQSLAAMREHGTLGERLNALTKATIARQQGGEPVARWPLAAIEEAGGWKHNYMRVEQFMTTDLITVHDDELVELVAKLMEWERIRHVPVEDHAHHLVGLVSYRDLLRVLGAGSGGAAPRAVSEVMKRELVTVAPGDDTLHAIALMREHRIGCLPVVKDGRLVGVVTEHDFMDIAAELLAQKLQES